ncbi:hypothetical protein [Burkholderia cenocepacia]|nr:hypothetical protein [Burkholderia cenocepacia]
MLDPKIECMFHFPAFYFDTTAYLLHVKFGRAFGCGPRRPYRPH